MLLKTSSKTKIQLAWRKFEKEVIALDKFYKIIPDPNETEVLQDEWHNFKFEVLPIVVMVMTIGERFWQSLQNRNWIGPLFPRLPEQHLVSMLKMQL